MERVTVVKVGGMSGTWCRELVEDTLSGILGVRGVNVDLPSARAEVRHHPSCTPARMRGALVRAGFCAGDLCALDGAALKPGTTR